MTRVYDVRTNPGEANGFFLKIQPLISCHLSFIYNKFKSFEFIAILYATFKTQWIIRKKHFLTHAIKKIDRWRQLHFSLEMACPPNTAGTPTRVLPLSSQYYQILRVSPSRPCVSWTTAHLLSLSLSADSPLHWFSHKFVLCASGLFLLIFSRFRHVTG